MKHQHVRARITRTSDADARGEPRGVGLCLSGGGSRAMTAGLGQLRALHHLQANGRSLLSQVSVLSTVSGGSWLGIPWVFLPPSVSDDAFVGGYVDDPGRLVPTTTHGHTPAETLDVIGSGSPGANIGRDFAIVDMLLDVLSLRLIHGTPFDMMWQIVVGRRLLGPYGLYVAGDHAEPTAMFSVDEHTRDTEIVDLNPGLADRTVHLRADKLDPTKSDRPELICNTALFVDAKDSPFEFLAPLQITPLTAGVISTPRGVEAAGRPVGGGSVASFAFGSALTELEPDDIVGVDQQRQLSLADIIGVSSAAYAQFVQDLGKLPMADTPRQHRRDLRRRMEIERALGDSPRHPLLTKILDHLKAFAMNRILKRLDPVDLVPRYKYWPVAGAEPDPDVAFSRLADGGSLENTGVASMLTRTHVDRIIACVNSPNAIKAERVGVVDVHDGVVTEQPGTAWSVASELPFLFGYRSHDPDVGYVRFEGTADHDLGADLMFKHNKVFEAKGFAELVAGLADASRATSAGPTWSEGDVGVHPAIVEQHLTTVDNEWFGIEGGRDVIVVWVYLNPVAAWNDAASGVQRQIRDAPGFPNYATSETELNATRVNLMCHLTSWMMANEANRQVFIDLFERRAR